MLGRFQARRAAAGRSVSRFLILTLAPGSYAAAPTKAADVNVSVNYGSPRQTVEGFGAAVTWIANDLDKFSAAKPTRRLNPGETERT